MNDDIKAIIKASDADITDVRNAGVLLSRSSDNTSGKPPILYMELDSLQKEKIKDLSGLSKQILMLKFKIENCARAKEWIGDIKAIIRKELDLPECIEDAFIGEYVDSVIIDKMF